MTRVGAIFVPHHHPPEALRAAAEVAEAAGVTELWLWEDCFVHSAYAAASVVLAGTEALHVGVGISPMPLRAVTAQAMEIATMARMFPGRFLPGVGHGVQSWMAQAGVRVASPLTLMREYVPALRALLRGEAVTTAGRYVALDDVRLGWPPIVSPRVYASAEGPKTLRLSGEVADGTVLDSRRTPDEVAGSVAVVRAGHAEAGRDDDHDVVAYVHAAFGDDAAMRLRDVFGSDVPADVEARGLTGTPDQVARGAQRFFDAGVDAVVLLPTADAVPAEFLRDVGAVTRLVGGAASASR